MGLGAISANIILTSRIILSVNRIFFILNYLMVKCGPVFKLTAWRYVLAGVTRLNIRASRVRGTGTLTSKLSRCKTSFATSSAIASEVKESYGVRRRVCRAPHRRSGAHFLPSWYKFYCTLARSRYKFDRSREFN